MQHTDYPHSEYDPVYELSNKRWKDLVIPKLDSNQGLTIWIKNGEITCIKSENGTLTFP
jgi:hypothetical protein